MREMKKEYSIEEAVEILKELQGQKLIKITGYSPLTISLRAKLSNNVEVVPDFMEKWSALWFDKYSGIKPNGYYIAQPVSANKSRMLEFMKEHPQFSQDVILKATENYLKEKALVNYEFCKKSNKFINDREGSILFSYCMAVMNGESELKEKVEGI